MEMENKDLNKLTSLCADDIFVDVKLKDIYYKDTIPKVRIEMTK